ncbi:hypothetical protein LTR37_009830 [Vermiconidia calcicola]|uniref:Uncharacterized protein n=1 Tax=Vermiconidia calcicola TaxID=1690605 RepID=A0ACC3N9Q2_9PEZI|nr:hypothetical protein LTR37_009830 [Vermiconidia calcicola]
MAVDKISPTDPRVKKDFKEVNGRKWYYWDAAAQGQEKGIVFLIHGYPDVALGWRYQIPMLTELGLRCIALDCMGYSDTGYSPELKDYTFKTHADAVAGIASQLNYSHIIVGGHDWGGAVVWRIAQWHPSLVTHVFSVCTPYFKVHDQYLSNEAIVKGGVPQFGYQLQFGSEDRVLEKAVCRDEGKIRKWLRGMYGGKPASGRSFMTPEEGVRLETLGPEGEEVGMTPLLSEEELDYYVAQYAKSGLEGPCNWYRTRRLNFEDEKSLPASQRDGIKQPTLFIRATKENILTEDLTRGMDKAIPLLTSETVPASHWALWHTPVETNEIVQRWVQGVVLGGRSKL